ncbi:MAG: sterol desaturase family protein [Gammaproteobacteria bacterium]|jgi:sterol desaturase/sphingolipid hydroxylase (fatty acid hydroxylase superfamily)
MMNTVVETLTLALIPGFLLLDLFVQARRYEKSRHWRLRGVVVTVAIVLLSGEVAAFWGYLFGDWHLFDTSALGLAGGAVTGVLVYEFFHYGYHRAAHQWNWLWRAGHQLHHSAESLDAFGAYYLHPFDAALFTMLSSLVFFPLLGLTVEAGMLGAFFLTFNAMFQHANVRTPHWLGYVIQRPESHAIHHARGVHRHNYSDLPLWDMVFGTFRNPLSVDGLQAGFYRGASSRLWEMLTGREVSAPPCPARVQTIAPEAAPGVSHVT